MHIVDVLNKLESLSGNALKAALKEHDTPLLRKVLRYALDPHKVYGIKQLPALPQSYTNDDREDAWLAYLFPLLDKLTARNVTGNAARNEVAAILSVVSARQLTWMQRVLLKDLRLGLDVKTVNSVLGAFIPTFEVALADKFKHVSQVTFPCVLSVKYDGKRTVSFVPPDRGDVEMLSRNGKPEQTPYAHIREQVHAMRDPFERLGVIRRDEVLVLDGELMFGMFGSRKAQESNADYVVFDALSMRAWTEKRCTRTQLTRSAQVKGAALFAQQTHIKHEECYIAENMEQVYWLYEQVLANGGEGVMIKDINGTYVWDRSSNWLKMKPVEDADLVVIDAFEGLKESTKGMLGGLVVDFNGVRVDVGNGFSKKQRQEWWPDYAHLLGKTIEVRYTEVTPDGSLRFPRFVKVREDK